MAADIKRYWQRHEHWSVLADTLKGRITKARTLSLWLSLGGAVLHTLTGFLRWPLAAKAASLGGALALAAVPFIAPRVLSADNIRKWLRARSVSEGLKSQVFRFLAGGPPYTGADRDAVFEKTCHDTEKWVDELATDLASVTVSDSPVPAVSDPDSYVRLRVTEQIESYYRPKARLNARQARRFARLELATAALAAVLGTVSSALQFGESGAKATGAWVAVLTTIGASIAAHAAASRFDLQARTFFATARELEDLRSLWEGQRAAGHAPGGEAWADLVGRCEDVISAENRGWMAKLDPEEKTT